MCSIFEDRHSLKDQIAKIVLDCIWVKFIHRIRLCREEVSFLWIMCWKAFSLVLFIDFFKSYLSHCTCTSQFPFFFCTHATQQRRITHDLHWPTHTDGTSDILWPMALFIWHNTQTLASSPISPPAVTLWSDHTNPLLQLHVLSPVTQEDQFISDEACTYSLKIRVLNDWLRLAALIFWSTDTSAFFLVPMCLYDLWVRDWCCFLL